MSEHELHRVPREVIQGKLLDALESDDCVAAIFSEQDLDDLLFAIDMAEINRPDDARLVVYDRLQSLTDGLQRLRNEAFPKPKGKL